MHAPGTARTRVAHFEIFLTRFLDEDGHLLADPPPGADDRQGLLDACRLMLRARSLDRKAIALQRTGKLGTYASSVGQEATGAAIGLALADDDVYLPNYRECAVPLARGVPMAQLLQYWSGDERGMAYATDSPAHHDLPLAVPVASQVPQAVGVAYALKLRGSARVALVSCGDGASSKGDFAEAVSAAGVWKLPLVFVVINNQWAISVPRAHQTAARTLAQKGLAGGLHSEQVDGNDVIATRFVIEQALQRARDGDGPSLIEAVTYRLDDHTTADDARRYRDEAEVKAAWAREPMKRLRLHLQAQHAFTPDDEAHLQAEVDAEVEAAVQAFAQLQPQPPQAIFDSLHAELPRELAWQREAVIAAARDGSA